MPVSPGKFVERILPVCNKPQIEEKAPSEPATCECQTEEEGMSSSVKKHCPRGGKDFTPGAPIGKTLVVKVGLSIERNSTPRPAQND